MSSDATILDELLTKLIRFNFSEISYMNFSDDEKEVENEMALRMHKEIIKISSDIYSVINSIKQRKFEGFAQDDLVRCKEKLKSIDDLIKENDDYNTYLEFVEDIYDEADLYVVEGVSSILSKFIKELEKHLVSTGSAARSQRPFTLPILDGEIEFDIVVNGQPLKLKSKDFKDFKEFLGGLANIFTCPITHNIMNDPVICSDGQTYERSAIQTWLASNNTSPYTGAKLDNKVLIPNIALRQAIEEYIELFEANKAGAEANNDGAEAKKAGSGYKNHKMKTRRKKSKNIRKSRKNNK